MAVVSLVTGFQGSGKSFSETLIMFEHLRDTSGNVFTNMPIKEKEFNEFCEQRGVTCGSRLLLINEEEFMSWISEEKKGKPNTGPWDLFEYEDLEEALIVIDECQLCMPATGNTLTRKRWVDWFSQIRKSGAQVHLCTQKVYNMDKRCLGLCERRIILTNLAGYIIPWIQIPLEEFFVLRWIITNKPFHSIRRTETIVEMDSAGTRSQRVQTVRTFVADEKIFAIYESRGKGHKVKISGAGMYEKKTIGKWFKVFIRKYWFRPTLIMMAIIISLYIIFGGWLVYGYESVQSYFLSIGPKHKTEQVSISKVYAQEKEQRQLPYEIKGTSVIVNDWVAFSEYWTKITGCEVVGVDLLPPGKLTDVTPSGLKKYAVKKGFLVKKIGKEITVYEKTSGISSSNPLGLMLR